MTAPVEELGDEVAHAQDILLAQRSDLHVVRGHLLTRPAPRRVRTATVGAGVGALALAAAAWMVVVGVRDPEPLTFVAGSESGTVGRWVGAEGAPLAERDRPLGTGAARSVSVPPTRRRRLGTQ